MWAYIDVTSSLGATHMGVDLNDVTSDQTDQT
jgi:hypothetical protein